MKAKVIAFCRYSQNLNVGEIVEIVPGMETDSEGIWNISAGKLFLCKKIDGTFGYIPPSYIQILPEEQNDNVDWDSFRREAAKDILCAILISDSFHCSLSVDDIPVIAIQYADGLIKKLKEAIKL